MRRHRHDAPRLVFQHRAQGRPAGVENDPVEPGLGPDMAARGLDRAPGALRHAPHLQILDRDRMRAIGKRPARPVLPVAPLAGKAPARLRQPGPRALPAPGAALLARQPPGEPLRPRLQAACVRGMEQPPVARRHLAGVHVHADGGPVILRFRDSNGMADDGIPLAGLALQNRRDRLAVRIRVAAPPADRHPAEAGKAQPTGLHLHARDDGQTVETPSAPETREAGRAARLHPAEETLERFVNPLQRPALDRDRHGRHVGQVPAADRQGLRLVDIRNRAARQTPGVGPLLEGGVV